jgi:hypothetical protein
MSEEEIIGKLGAINVNDSNNADSKGDVPFDDIKATISNDDGDDRKMASLEESETVYYQDLMTEEFESNDTRLVFIRAVLFVLISIVYIKFASQNCYDWECRLREINVNRSINKRILRRWKGGSSIVSIEAPS